MGISLNSIVTMVLPWWILLGRTFVRWSTFFGVVGTVLLVNTTHATWSTVLDTTGFRVQGPLSLTSISTISAFSVQLVPAIITPLFVAGGVAGLITRPYGLMLGTVATAVAAVLLVLEIITPIFLSVPLSVQVLLRLVVLPLTVELSLAGIRLSVRGTFTLATPRALMHVFLVQITVASALIMRVLGTNMDSTAASLGLALGTSVVEVLFRITMPYRDQAYAWLLARCTCRDKGPRRSAQERRQDLHAYYSFLLLDTMSEDIGILTTLPLSLLYRLPARVGGQPIAPGDLVLRVAVQYALELMTDLGPSLVFCTSASLCVSKRTRAGMVAALQEGMQQLQQRGKVAKQAGGAIAPPAVASSLLDDAEQLPGPAVASSPLASQGRAAPDPTPSSRHTPSLEGGDAASPTSPTPRLAEHQPEAELCETRCCLACCPCCARAVLRAGDPDVTASRRRVAEEYAAFLGGLQASGLWGKVTPSMFTAAAAKACDAEEAGSSGGEASLFHSARHWLLGMVLLTETSAVRLSAAWFSRIGGWIWVLSFVAGSIAGTAVVGRTLFSDYVRCARLDQGGDIYYDFCPAPEE